MGRENVVANNRYKSGVGDVIGMGCYLCGSEWLLGGREGMVVIQDRMLRGEL